MNTKFFASVCFFSVVSFLGCISPSPKPSGEFQRFPQSANPGVLTVQDPSKFSRVMVISDVHGMINEVLRILKAAQVVDSNQNWTGGHALLIVAGDSIDKGPYSVEVIDLWIQLQKQAAASGGMLIHVLGNHEAELLADPLGSKKARELFDELNAKRIPISDLTSLETSRGRFLHSEPVAARIGNWLICHSGFYPDLTWREFTVTAEHVLQAQDYQNSFLIGDDSILEAKDWDKKDQRLQPMIERLDEIGIFGVVFGHQPGAFGIRGRSAAKLGGRLIKIDNGMAPEGGLNPGSLLVFTDPKQMNSMAFPRIQIITPDGSTKSLQPE